MSDATRRVGFWAASGVGGRAIPIEAGVTDDSPDPTDAPLRPAAERLTGCQERLFQAEAALARCGGCARRRPPPRAGTGGRSRRPDRTPLGHPLC